MNTHFDSVYVAREIERYRQEAMRNSLPVAPTPVRASSELVAELLPPMNSNSVDEYLSLATKIGLISPATQELKLQNFLQREEIPVFDSGKVEAHMNALVKKLTPPSHYTYRWGWSGLRELDIQTNGKGSTEYFGVYSGRLYSKPVPHHAVQLAGQILEKCPDASFFVSDVYAVPRPDPFLAVGYPGGKKFVIDMWDEPDFKLI